MKKRIRYLFLILAFPLQFIAAEYYVNISTNTCGNSQIYTIPDGEQIVLHAHPIAGYIFSQWSDGNTDNPRIVTIASDVSYTAEFVAAPMSTTYNVTVYADGCTPKVTPVADGEQIVLHAHPIAGYIFSQWSDGNTDNPRIVTIASDVSYTAEFVAIPMPTTYNVTVYADGCTPKVIPVAEGEQILLNAHPIAGYTFAQWSDGNTDNPRIVTVTSDASYAAEFVAMSPMPTAYDVTVYADGCATPKVIPVIEGEQILLNAHAKSGYVFSQWSDGNTDNPRAAIINADATFRALFEVSTAPNPDGVYTFTINAENCSTSLSQTFSQGTEVKLYAEPIDCNYFVRWSDGNTDNPRTVIVDGNATYTAEFSPNQYIITVVSDDENQGTVSVEKNR